MITTIKSGLAHLRSRSVAFPAAASILKHLVPLVLLAIGLTALLMMYMWRDQSGYKPVFGVREKIGVTDMMSALDAEHIPYRLHPDSGQVLVPEGMLGKVRMMLAAKGVTAQLPLGLELMDRNDPLGVSQFVQDVRFRRGLEGELAQSIMTIEAISSARVHLSIAKSSSFVASDGEKSSASVILAMKPRRTLGPEQIAAIINLVAGSVANLNPQRVSLVDQAGNLLSAHVDLTDGFDTSNNGNESARRFQDETRRNIRDLLGPVLGEDNFKVSVTAAINNDKIEETQETYGENPKVTSEAMRDEQDRNHMALGIPGSLSNRPPSSLAGGEKPSNADKTAEQGSARKNATTRQYAYDRSITQIKRSRGRLSNLSVAVVLNSNAAPAPKTGWTSAELADIDRILRNGLGIDAQRGDNLMVSALAFPARQAPTAWWQERENIVDIGTWISYALVAVLTFFLLIRPLMRLATLRLAVPLMHTGAVQIANNTVNNPALSASSAEVGTAQASTSRLAGPMPVVPLLENYDLPPAGSAVDVMVDHLKVLAGKEPERVAEVVKQWMQKNGRTQ